MAEFFDDKSLLLVADRLDGEFLAQLLRRGSERDNLLALLSIDDGNVFFGIVTYDTIQLRERLTDVSFAAASRNARHFGEVLDGFRFFFRLGCLCLGKTECGRGRDGQQTKSNSRHLNINSSKALSPEPFPPLELEHRMS